MELSTKSSAITRDQSNILLFLAGLIGLSFMASGFYLNYQKKALAFAGTAPVAIKNYFQEKEPPKKIDFINLGVSAPVRESVIKDGIWDSAKDSASFLATSAKPGENGNIVVYGPDSKEVFGPVKNTKVGDFINLSTEGGEIHSFVVKELQEVSPDRTDVIEPTDNEVLTVYTSTGILSNKRFVIKAYPVNAD